MSRRSAADIFSMRACAPRRPRATAAGFFSRSIVCPQVGQPIDGGNRQPDALYSSDTGRTTALDRRSGGVGRAAGGEVTDEELNSRLEDMEKRIKLQEAMHDMETRLVERMRHIETELERAFEAFSSAQTIRLGKVEAGHSNLDRAASGRLDVVEKRLLEIELRLAMR
jgi:hypothetical protein